MMMVMHDLLFTTTIVGSVVREGASWSYSRARYPTVLLRLERRCFLLPLLLLLFLPCVYSFSANAAEH